MADLKRQQIDRSIDRAMLDSSSVGTCVQSGSFESASRKTEFQYHGARTTLLLYF